MNINQWIKRKEMNLLFFPLLILVLSTNVVKATEINDNYNIAALDSIKMHIKSVLSQGNSMGEANEESTLEESDISQNESQIPVSEKIPQPFEFVNKIQNLGNELRNMEMNFSNEKNIKSSLNNMGKLIENRMVEDVNLTDFQVDTKWDTERVSNIFESMASQFITSLNLSKEEMEQTGDSIENFVEKIINITKSVGEITEGKIEILRKNLMVNHEKFFNTDMVIKVMHSFSNLSFENLQEAKKSSTIVSDGISQCLCDFKKLILDDLATVKNFLSDEKILDNLKDLIIDGVDSLKKQSEESNIMETIDKVSSKAGMLGITNNIKLFLEKVTTKEYMGKMLDNTQGQILQFLNEDYISGLLDQYFTTKKIEEISDHVQEMLENPQVKIQKLLKQVPSLNANNTTSPDIDISSQNKVVDISSQNNVDKEAETNKRESMVVPIVLLATVAGLAFYMYSNIMKQKAASVPKIEE